MPCVREPSMMRDPAFIFALLHDSIWHGRNWGATLRMMFDGLVYALLTAGVFGWLWPR